MTSIEYPRMTRSEAIDHCKYWAEQIRLDGIDLLVKDYEAAVGVSDQLAYPLDMQEWITPDDEPLLYVIRVYAMWADSNHKVRNNWEKLLILIDALNAEDEKDNSKLFD